MMKGEGFRLNDDRGEGRRHFRFVEGGENMRSTYRALRLPFATLKGCHPCVYLCFLEDFAHWKGEVAVKEAFCIEIEPVGNEVTCWEDDIFPSSWKNEKHVLWYKYTLDNETVKRSISYGLESEYEKEFGSDMMEKLNQRESAIEDMMTLVKFEERVDDKWKRCRLVCLRDVCKLCFILSHLQLSRVIQDMGFEQEAVVTYRRYSKQTDETQVGLQEISLKSQTWFYRKQSLQSYRFTGKAKGLPWLPHPNMLGCHPLMYLQFLLPSSYVPTVSAKYREQRRGRNEE